MKVVRSAAGPLLAASLAGAASAHPGHIDQGVVHAVGGAAAFIAVLATTAYMGVVARRARRGAAD